MNQELNAQRDFFTNLSAQAFLELGAAQLAYVKPVTVQNRPGYAVYGGNGKLLTIQESENAVFQILSSNDIDMITLQ